MKVLKFGGTSIGTAERIKKVSELILERQPVIVVLSAMAGTTDMLLSIDQMLKRGDKQMAKESTDKLKQSYLNTSESLFSGHTYRARGEKFITELFDRVYRIVDGSNNNLPETANTIVSIGEQLSTGLLHLYLSERGTKAAYIPALEYMRILKKKEPDYFYIRQNLERLLRSNTFAPVYITEGFICRNADGRIDNLGRGGSDYSASIIANTINADSLEIWTDIDGLQNNDPRYVEGTSPIRQISYDEADELAYFGAKILHPSTVKPCRVKQIPVLLKNTLAPSDPGTEISSVQSAGKIKAIAAKDGICHINIRSLYMLMAHGFLRSVFEVFDRYQTAVDMITTSEVAISLTIDNTEHLREIITELSQFATVSIQLNQTIICIVGNLDAKQKGYAAQIIGAIKEIPLRMISYGASSKSLSLLIDHKYKAKALRLLHAIISPEQPEKISQTESQLIGNSIL